MKAYTDIKQSKKLAEILPIESADMVYIDAGYCSRVLPSNDIDANSYPIICPCWSLAALLNVIPKQVMLNGITEDSYWYCKCEDAFNSLFADSNNPIDACYEIILKLHEQKLI